MYCARVADDTHIKRLLVNVGEWTPWREPDLEAVGTVVLGQASAAREIQGDAAR